MPRRNGNAGNGTAGGGIRHGGRASMGIGDNQARSLEFALHEQWNAYMRNTTSRERRAVRRDAA